MHTAAKCPIYTRVTTLHSCQYRQYHDFECTEKCSGAYYTKLQEKSRYYLITIYMKLTPQKGKTDETLKPCAPFVIFTRVTTLYSCYMRIYSFSANQKRIIFPCILLSNKRRVFVRPLKSAFKLSNKHDFISLQLEQYGRQACT